MADGPPGIRRVFTRDCDNLDNYRPFSRNPVYRQPALQAAPGARYVHVPELGNRNYRGGPIAIVDLAGGIEAVRELLTQYPAVVLMCVCAEVEHCHRLPVAVALGDALNEPVEHVRLDREEPQLELGV